MPPRCLWDAELVAEYFSILQRSGRYRSGLLKNSSLGLEGHDFIVAAKYFKKTTRAFSARVWFAGYHFF